MHSTHTQAARINQSLRTVAADFFRMDVARAPHSAPAIDRNPLRRQVSAWHEMDDWVPNENMCTALWQLMAHS